MQGDDGEVGGSAVRVVRRRLPELDALPLPGKGSTRLRWEALAAVGRENLVLARLAEGHADARAILTELGRVDLLADGEMWGVWAAEPQRLTATPARGGWRLVGGKAWCSGSIELDMALVTAVAPDGPRLFAVEVGDLSPCAGSWQPVGMVATRSDTMAFHDHWVRDDRAVGDVDAYVQRPGFGHGGCGVAACWWGGGVGVLDGLHHAVATGRADAAALGKAAAGLTAAGHALAAAAAAVDEQPEDAVLAERLARETRLVVAAAARGALDQAIEAMGASGLCHRPDHSTRIADLLVYLSQHRERPTASAHGEALAAVPLSLSW